MATRLYMVAATVPGVTPAPDAGWPDTTQAVRRKLATAQAVATETLSGTSAPVASSHTLVVQLVSPPLSGAQTISGTWTAISRGRELLAEDNINSRSRAARVYASDGSLRGTLVAQGAAAATTEMLATPGGQQHALTSGVASVAAQDGDYIVVELGYGTTLATGVTPQWEMVLGGVGTDHGTSNNDATGSVPWIEFSATLTFQAGVSAVLAATLPALAGAFTAEAHADANLAAVLPALTGDVDGRAVARSTLAATLPALTADLAGVARVAGVLAGTLPELRAQLLPGVRRGTMRHATRTAPAASAATRAVATARQARRSGPTMTGR